MSQGHREGGPSLGDRVAALPRMFSSAISGQYPNSRARLSLLVLALAYLVSPIDLLPEAFLGLLGLLDDAVVAVWLGGAFLDETDRFVRWERDPRSPGISR